jgi:hypothetical protein
MRKDAASLDNLRDLVELAPVSWWPWAAGWWLVIGLSVVTVNFFMIRAWQNWHANAYRRAALKELGGATDVAVIADILKRTALSAYPRNQIASLSGPAWCHWLGESGNQALSDAVAHCLTEGVYDNADRAGHEELARYAEQWVKNHRTESAPC